MLYPSLEEAKTYEKDYRTVPVSKSILSDMYTPLQLLGKLKTLSSHVYMLESVEDARIWGRYTFLGYDPKMEITCRDRLLKSVEGDNVLIKETDDPGAYLTEVLDMYKSPKIEGMPAFTGGLTGYFSYDYMKYLEQNLTLNADDDEGFNDFDLMLFDKVIAFDNLKQQTVFIVNISTDDLEANYLKAEEEIDEMIKTILDADIKEETPLALKEEFTPLFSREKFCEMVEAAKKYIYEGDIFQVVLSNRFSAYADGSLFDTYRMLRVINPSPYMFYFSSDDIEIAGASPETLVKLKDGVLHTYPLAGTRPRGKDEEEDLLLEESLLNDPKELAEHNMLVDLGRNDIGKVSKFGSVTVDKYLRIARYSHVMHIGSTVRGEIRNDKNAVDAIGAILPAGTLSGAPKFRAAQIIDELENSRRGIYGGAIGYLDFTGNMDVCIAIRIAWKKNGKVFVRTGAGIVSDSVPKCEYQETINKGKAVIQAVKESEGGIYIDSPHR